MKGRAPPDPRRARIHFSYSVAEAAKLYGVHRNTVRAWLKAGLPSIACGRQRLILGSDLRDFLTARRQARRTKSPPGSLYCFKCRAPRTPDPALTELTIAPTGAGNVRGICGECGNLMNRRVSLSRLAEAGFGALRQAGCDAPSR